MYFNIQAVNCEIKIPGKMSPDYNITQNYMKFINQMFFQKKQIYLNQTFKID